MKAALLVVAACQAPAQAPPPSSTPPELGVLDFVRLGSLAFSPDGATLAYVARSYPQDFRSRLSILDLASGVSRELTPDGKSDRAPQWRPTGHELAYLSNRGGAPQVYLDGVPLTKAKHGVGAFHWSPDGAAIAYLAKDDDAPASDRGPQVADDERQLARLWILDVATREAHRVGATGYRIDDFAWRDRAQLLVAATDQPRVDAHTDRIYRAESDAFVEVARPPQPFRNLLVSPDGAQLAVLSTATHGPIARDLFVGPLGGTLVDVTQALDRAVVQVQWQARRWMTIADGFVTRLYVDGAPVALPLSVGAFAVHGDVVAFAGEDFAHPQELYLRAADGSVRQLTHVQPPLPLAPTTIFHIPGETGDLEAALVAPASPNHALVLLVHGGPSSRFVVGYTWELAWAQALAQHGYQVLMVNPRGSNGYSEAFVAANRGDFGGGDYRDLLAVLDAVIARGGVDPKRIGIGGWSYGGEMSAWAITQSDRFRAAVVGAGVFDQRAEFETEEDPADDEWYLGTPWEHPEVFARNSPSTFIAHAHTPTLILDGADDEANPVGQSIGLYRALKHLGVPTELVTYPGEGHSPNSGTNNRDMFDRIVGWYDRYL